MAEPKYLIKDDGVCLVDVRAQWDDPLLTDRKYKFAYDGSDLVTDVEILDSTETYRDLIGEDYAEIDQSAFDAIMEILRIFRIGGHPPRP